jgi:dUTP pyrophosphatase
VAKIYNHGNEPYTFRYGDKLTQLVIMPIPQVELTLVTEFADTERGDNGFGSSGR